MKKPLDWKEVGKFFAILLELFKTIRDTLTEAKIGLEIIGWLNAEGRQSFIDDFLRPLGEKFLEDNRVIVVDARTIRVNLGMPPKESNDESRVISHSSGDWATIQRRGESLYLDNREVVLAQTQKQMGGESISGEEFCEFFLSYKTLDSNLMFALLHHPHLIPDSWEIQELFRNSGDPRNINIIYFLGTVYDNTTSKSSPYVFTMSRSDKGMSWEVLTWEWAHTFLFDEAGETSFALIVE